MPGRNDACPCGSGKKYKKCCLEDDNVQRRRAAAVDLFEEQFLEAVDAVYIEAIHHHGVDALNRWSVPLQGGDARFEEDLFKSFVACHHPFQGASSLTAWVLNHGRLEESQRQLLTETLTVPFSLWVIDEVRAGMATARDLLLGTKEEVALPYGISDCQPGQVNYGKVCCWQDHRILFSPGPVRIPEEMAQLIVRQVKGKRKKMTYLDLMDPTTQATLYLSWCSTFRRLMEDHDEGERELPTPPDHHQLVYAFDPRKQAWVDKALSASSAFARKGAMHFCYPATGEVEAILDLGPDTLLVHATRVPEIEVLKQALQAALGGTASLREHQSVNLMEHLLQHGLHHPIFPGTPAMADALLPEELALAEQAVERLRSMSDDSFFAFEEQALETICARYLEQRSETVSSAILKQDTREIDKLKEFLGSDASWEQFCDFFPVYLSVVHKKRRKVGDRVTELVLESMRAFVEWLGDNDLLEPEDYEEIEGALLGSVKEREAATFTLRWTLVDSSPPVWRDLRVPGRYRLDQVHKMLQILFGWKDYHLHDFEIQGRLYTDMETHDADYDQGERDERIPLAQALGLSKSLAYRYDFGDSWEVQATLLEASPGDNDSPRCLAGENAGPPEDCGGIPGFENLKAVLANPRDPEYQEMKRWAPRGYDATAFSAEAMTRKLVAKFGRKTAAAKAPEGVTLAGYRLSRMKVLGAAVAALRERSPLSLEQMQARLEELGYPLKAGKESLRRALATTRAAAKDSDGAYRLVDGPALEEVLMDMDYENGVGLPRSAGLVELD